MASTEKSFEAALAEVKKRANAVYRYLKWQGNHVWVYPDGSKITVYPEKASASARDFVLNYGFVQWLQDGCASGDTAAEKYEMMAARATLLNEGTEASGLLRRGGGGTTYSYVTRALIRLGTFGGRTIADAAEANALIKDMAEGTGDFKALAEKYKFGGQVGKVRTWLETNSAKIKEAIQAIKDAEAAETPAADADAELEALIG